jgi:hypothetical protein
MPNEVNVQTMYLGPTGNPDTFNESTLYAGGSLGQRVEVNDLSYQLVKADSGATAATATGAIAAAQLAFWKDPDNYVVTNNSPQALGGQVANAYRNFVAGVFRTSVTAGNYCYILQRGSGVNVKMTSGGGVGQLMMANTGTAADAVAVAVATALTYLGIGVQRAASSGNLVNCDLNVPSAP